MLLSVSSLEFSKPFVFNSKVSQCLYRPEKCLSPIFYFYFLITQNKQHIPEKIHRKQNFKLQQQREDVWLNYITDNGLKVGLFVGALAAQLDK